MERWKTGLFVLLVFVSLFLSSSTRILAEEFVACGESRSLGDRTYKAHHEAFLDYRATKFGFTFNSIADLRIECLKKIAAGGEFDGERNLFLSSAKLKCDTKLCSDGQYCALTLSGGVIVNVKDTLKVGVVGLNAQGKLRWGEYQLETYSDGSQVATGFGLYLPAGDYTNLLNFEAEPDNQNPNFDIVYPNEIYTWVSCRTELEFRGGTASCSPCGQDHCVAASLIGLVNNTPPRIGNAGPTGGNSGGQSLTSSQQR